MSRVQYEAGIARLSDTTATYLQPDGGFGLSNAGIVLVGGEALLVDTFFDLPSTRRLLEAIDVELGAAVRRVVNTHANGDHCWGNQLVGDAEIIAHRICAAEMGNLPPALLQAAQAGQIEGPMGEYLRDLSRPFDFSGIEITLPTTTFDDELTLDVGGTEVLLTYVGPSHTGGDITIHVPDEGVLFAGDIIFRNCHPLSWEGTIGHWIAALERIEAMDVETVVPGHGPVGGTDGATEMREYFEFVEREGRRHYAAGRSLREAAELTDLGPYARWGEPERIVHNMARVFREAAAESGGDEVPDSDPMSLFAMMAELAAD